MEIPTEHATVSQLTLSSDRGVSRKNKNKDFENSIVKLEIHREIGPGWKCEAIDINLISEGMHIGIPLSEEDCIHLAEYLLSMIKSHTKLKFAYEEDEE